MDHFIGKYKLSKLTEEENVTRPVTMEGIKSYQRTVPSQGGFYRWVLPNPPGTDKPQKKKAHCSWRLKEAESFCRNLRDKCILTQPHSTHRSYCVSGVAYWLQQLLRRGLQEQTVKEWLGGPERIASLVTEQVRGVVWVEQMLERRLGKSHLYSRHNSS